MQHAQTQLTMLSQILQLPDNSTHSLLVRHSDRDKIAKGTFGNDVPLNEKGLQNALAFGQGLSGLKINRIFSSPVGRCIQTAEQIRKGCGQDIEIFESNALGLPGLHINDEVAAGSYFLEHGLHKIYEQFVEGIEMPGMVHRDDLGKILTEFIVGNSAESGLTIFVSHDSLITQYRYCLDQTIYTRENWLDFLSGLLLTDGKLQK